MSAIAQSLDGTALRERVRKEGRVLLTNVTWKTYKALLDSVGEVSFPHAYHERRLELMGKSRPHELYKWLLGRFVEVWVDEHGMPLEVGGEMTLQREDAECGVEGDECYWIKNAPLILGRMDPDFMHDPPPDLVLESEVSTTVVDKLSIYAALKVPEIWRISLSGIQVGRLQSDGQYAWGEESAVLPGFPFAEALRFLQMYNTTDQLSIVRQFRAWVREHLGK
jgi:Uma2 family endonuclease